MTTQQLFKKAAQTGKHRMAPREGYIAIIKGRTQVNFWDDGTITRGDIRCDLAVKMTVAQAAKVLGLD